jgi:hypothetical protein
MSVVSFPIYFVDADGWMGLVESLQELQTRLEQNDVEDGEVHGWDVSGMSFRLLWEGDRIVIDVTGSTMEPEALIEAMRRYADLERIEVELESGLPPQELWAAIQRSIRARGVFGWWRSVRKRLRKT